MANVLPKSRADFIQVLLQFLVGDVGALNSAFDNLQNVSVRTGVLVVFGGGRWGWLLFNGAQVLALVLWRCSNVCFDVCSSGCISGLGDARMSRLGLQLLGCGGCSSTTAAEGFRDLDGRPRFLLTGGSVSGF